MTRLGVDPELVGRFRTCLEVLAPDLVTSEDDIGVAVSGGPDSVAALLLATAALPHRIKAISIDHQLRSASAAECARAADVCRDLDVPHETVRVTVDPKRIGLQAAARVARRKAWREWAERWRLAGIVTGHHADDQAETVLMRLARGAGVGGLSGIPQKSSFAGTAEKPIHLLRPLLGWSRAELASIVRDAGIEPADDPSNGDPRFDRARFRAMLAGTDLLPAKRLAAAADHLRDADEALDWMADRLNVDHLVVHEAHVQLRAATMPFELLRRLAGEALAELAAYPDGSDVAALVRRLQDGRTATLAGIKAVPNGEIWTFTPAPPHRSH